MTRHCGISLLFTGAGHSDELRKFGWSEGDVVLRVKQQSIAIELKIQRGIVGSFREYELYGESILRAPGAGGGDKWICQYAESAIEAVSKLTAAVGPRVSSDRHARLAGGVAYDQRRRRQVEIKRHCFETAIVFFKLEPLS